MAAVVGMASLTVAHHETNTSSGDDDSKQVGDEVLAGSREPLTDTSRYTRSTNSLGASWLQDRVDEENGTTCSGEMKSLSLRSQYHSIHQLSRPSPGGSSSRLPAQHIIQDGALRIERHDADRRRRTSTCSTSSTTSDWSASSTQRELQAVDEIDQILLHRKRTLSPTTRPLTSSPSSGTPHGSLVMSWTGMACGDTEAKRARVENIINSMQVTTEPVFGEAPETSLLTGCQMSAKAVECSPDVDQSTAAEEVLGNDGLTSETGESAMRQRRSSRRKQYVPQHQDLSGRYEEDSDDSQSLVGRPNTDCESDKTQVLREEQDGDFRNEYKGQILEEEAKLIQTEAVREGLRRAQHRLADMHRKFIGLANDDEVVVDVEGEEETSMTLDLGNDINRNQIGHSISGSWFRSLSSDINSIMTKKIETKSGAVRKGKVNGGELEKMAAILKDEISDSVGSLVDDIVRTFIERHFNHKDNSTVKSNIDGDCKRDRMKKGGDHVTTGNTCSSGALSYNVISGCMGDEKASLNKLSDTETESNLALSQTSLLPVSTSPGAGSFPFLEMPSLTSADGDKESIRQSAARLVAYRQALAAAYLDSAFVQPSKTAFEVPRDQERMPLPPLDMATLHPRFASHSYFTGATDATDSRFEPQQQQLVSMPFVKEPEQTEAIPLVVNAPKKKRTKVTDTRLSPRAARALLHESLQQHANEHHQLDMVPRLCSPASPPSHQHHHHHHHLHQQQLSYDSLLTNNLESRIRGVSPMDEAQHQQTMYDRHIHGHHPRHNRHRHEQQTNNELRQPSAPSMHNITGQEVDSSSSPSLSLHDVFRRRSPSSHSHHHQRHHRVFGSAASLSSSSHQQPMYTTPINLISGNDQTTSGLAFPPPLVPQSSLALEQHIQAIYVAAAVAAAAHSANRVGSSVNSSVASISSPSSVRNIHHQHHARSLAAVPGATHHTQFAESLGMVSSRPEVAELGGCIVGGRAGCSGRMLMKQDQSSSALDKLLMQTANYDGMAVTSTLTPMHLRKAKLMFFYVRYPSSSVLKEYFPDVRFNKNNTAQLVKWFSNFREFFYIQMEKYARQALSDGVKSVNDLIVTTDAEIFRVLVLHYNRNNQIEVPESFRYAIQAALGEFFVSIAAEKDQEQSWKKAIYKVIARLDEPVPEYFKSSNWLEQIADC